jgi:two-component sensor histidine kinase/PAS domain-containing protein
VFHYALRPDGFLLLGPSENVSRHGRLFETIDKKWRIFKRRETGDRTPVRFPLIDLVAGGQQRQRTNDAKDGTKSRRDQVVALAERSILDDLGPAYVVVGENRELVYSGGHIEPYLKLKKGDPSLEILTMAHEGLRMDLRAVLHRAAAEQREAVREKVSFETAEGRRRVTLICRPLGEGDNSAQHYLIAFRDLGPPEPEGTARSENAKGDLGQVQALESELRATKEYLQTTTEELESSNEELKSANEELMSMNEELQSSNEELETSKEELQSVNEELETVNAELASKVEELGRLNADLQNLLESTQIAVLFLDRGMRVRRFTPVAKEIFHLIDSDLGRSITDINARVVAVDLAKEVEGVLATLAPVEHEVTLRDGQKTYQMRLLPYRTPGDVIDGVVATFVDVTRMQKVQGEIDALNDRLQAQVDDLEALLDLAPIGIAFADDAECKSIEVNRYGAQIMKIPRKSPPAGNRNANYRFVRDGSDIPPEDLPLQMAWRTGKPVRDFRATYFPSDGAAFEYLMSAAPVLDAEGNVRQVIGVYDDVTRLVEAQAAAEIRAAQQDFLATTGSLSLRGQDARELTRILPEQLARMLRVDYAKVLMYQPETNDFRLEATHGFSQPPGTVVGGGLNSQAGYTLQSAAPIIVERLAEEQRFSGPPLLREAGVVSGISVIIGDPENPWGVLGIHTRQYRKFTADDVKFLQSIANVLAATLERDAWGRQQRLLLDELRHRVKNNLATVQAIAGLSFGRQASENPVVEGFMARLMALAAAHDLRFQSDWKDVDFGELVRRQVTPYVSEGQIKVEGRSGIRLPAAMAIDIAMVVHELVTNAIKHGALSTPDGTVRIGWSIDDGAAAHDQIPFHWQEKGGPKVNGPPAVNGVGTTLMDAISNRSDLKLERTFGPEGLDCRIAISVDKSAPD